MIWTCQNPECPCPGVENPVDADKCWRCGQPKDPAEERDAVAAGSAGFKAAGWRGWNEESPGAAEKKFAIGFYRAARAPLIAEIEALRARLSEVECEPQEGETIEVEDGKNEWVRAVVDHWYFHATSDLMPSYQYALSPDGTGAVRWRRIQNPGVPR